MTTLVDHERNVAGWLMGPDADAAWLELCEAQVSDEQFTDPLCVNVVRCAAFAKEQGRTLDIFAVRDSAVRVGCELQAADCMRLVDEAVIIPGHLAPSLAYIKSEALRRAATMFFKRGAERIEGFDDLTEGLHKMNVELAALLSSQTSRSSSVHHITHYREEKVEQWKSAKNCGFVGLPSSLPEIDRHLGGYRRRVMTVIGGYRGEGKSLFLRQELYSMATKGFKVLLVTLEDPEDMASAIVAGHAARSSIFALDVGTASPFKIQDIDDTWAAMENLPFWTAGARTIEDIVSVCMTHKAKHGLDAVGIDHIQYISPYQRPKMDRNGTIALYSNAICGLLKDVDSAGLVASQFTRGAEKDNRRPRLSDLRDSGTIEQDCRQALLLSRDGEGHILEVAKNNFGPSGVDIGLKRIGNEHRFEYREIANQGGMV